MGENEAMLRSLTEQSRRLFLNEFFQWMHDKMKVATYWEKGILHVDVEKYGKNPSA